jgi:hypothetical protein
VHRSHPFSNGGHALLHRYLDFEMGWRFDEQATATHIS